MESNLIEEYGDALVKSSWYKEKARRKKKELNRQFVKDNKKTFRLLDFAVLLIFLFNFGAAMLTSAMVVEETAMAGEELVVMEVNPVQAELNGYEIHPESKSILKKTLIFIAMWTALLFFYVHERRNVFTQLRLTVMIGMVMYAVFTLGYDFFNDFGYWIGVKMFMG